MIAEPRMWPASRNVAWIPGATSSSTSYGIGRKRRRASIASTSV